MLERRGGGRVAKWKSLRSRASSRAGEKGDSMRKDRAGVSAVSAPPEEEAAVKVRFRLGFPLRGT